MSSNLTKQQKQLISIRCFSPPGRQSPIHDNASSINSTLKYVHRGRLHPSTKIHDVNNHEVVTSKLRADKDNQDEDKKNHAVSTTITGRNPNSSTTLATSIFTIHVGQSKGSKHDRTQLTSHARVSSFGRSNETASLYDTDRRVSQQKKRQRRRYHVGYCFTCIPYYWIIALICIFLIAFAIAALVVALLIKPNSVEVTTIQTTIFVSNTNMLVNGNAETGNCATIYTASNPPGWNYDGNITQIYYNTTVLISGPPTASGAGAGTADLGSCFFYGYTTIVASMWQTINLTTYADSSLIDGGTVKFNLSAWLGGAITQNDSAIISLTFYDQANQILNATGQIGPVLVPDRASQTILLFKQTNGFVPTNARSVTINATFTLYSGSANNAYVDNIGLYLYQ